MSEMIIRPIPNQENLNQCFEQAKLDGHSLVVPTHEVTLDGELRGTLSEIPTFLIWMHTKRNGPKDTLALQKALEHYTRMRGTKFVCVPCREDSPYFKIMEGRGYVNCGPTTLFVKAL